MDCKVSHGDSEQRVQPVLLASLPEIVARVLRQLHTAQCPHFLRKQYHSQCGGWWVPSPPRCTSVSVAAGPIAALVTDALHRRRNNRNTPSAPAKWTVCTLRTLVWGQPSTGPAFAYHRICSHPRACRQQYCKSCRSCDTATQPVTADLLARDIAALLPSVTQESSARDGQSVRRPCLDTT